MKTIKEIMEYTTKNGGATFKYCAGKKYSIIIRDSGYQVGIGKIFVGMFEPDELLQDYLLGLIDNVMDGAEPGSYGVWYDKDNEKLYIDKTKTFINLAQAILTAKENKELAIWDWKNNKEIDVSELEIKVSKKG